jgi:hypothetical protein
MLRDTSPSTPQNRNEDLIQCEEGGKISNGTLAKNPGTETLQGLRWLAVHASPKSDAGTLQMERVRRSWRGVLKMQGQKLARLI